MSDAWLLAASMGVAYLGFASLALSQERHWKTLTGGTAPKPLQALLLRGLGSLALGLSLALALIRDGLSFGAILWVTMLSAAAAAVALTLTWRAWQPEISAKKRRRSSRGAIRSARH